MKKTIMVSLLLATGLTNAADLSTNPFQVTYELKLEKIKNNSSELLNDLKLSTLTDVATPYMDNKTITYLKEYRIDPITNQPVLIPDTIKVGLNSNIKFTPSKNKDEYEVKFVGEYSELLSLNKSKTEKVDIELPQIREWKFSKSSIVKANQSIVLGTNNYYENNLLGNNKESEQYKITLKIIPQ
jgi:hypothetical protein